MHLVDLQLVVAPSAVDRDLFQFRLALDPVSVFELDQMRAVSIDVEQDSIDRVQRDRDLAELCLHRKSRQIDHNVGPLVCADAEIAIVLWVNFVNGLFDFWFADI